MSQIPDQFTPGAEFKWETHSRASYVPSVSQISKDVGQFTPEQESNKENENSEKTVARNSFGLGKEVDASFITSAPKTLRCDDQFTPGQEFTWDTSRESDEQSFEEFDARNHFRIGQEVEARDEVATWHLAKVIKFLSNDEICVKWLWSSNQVSTITISDMNPANWGIRTKTEPKTNILIRSGKRRKDTVENEWQYGLWAHVFYRPVQQESIMQAFVKENDQFNRVIVAWPCFEGEDEIHEERQTVEIKYEQLCQPPMQLNEKSEPESKTPSNHKAVTRKSEPASGLTLAQALNNAIGIEPAITLCKDSPNILTVSH